MRAPQRVPLDRLSQRVTVYEVGPSDGLQNKSSIVPIESFPPPRGPFRLL